MDTRQPKKSMLGNRRSHSSNTTFTDIAMKKFEIIPKNVQIAESLRKNRNASNIENTFIFNLKNISTRQPRKSMLGTRKLQRSSIIPAVSESSAISVAHESPKLEYISSTDNTVTKSEFKTNDSVVRTSIIEDELLRRDSILRVLPEDIFRKPHQSTLSIEKPTSPVAEPHVPVRKMLSSFSPDSNDSSFIENETVLASEVSVQATPITETTATNENSILATTLKDISNTSVESLKDERTLLKNTVSESNEFQKEEDTLFKMLDLVNTWVQRNTESVEIYQKQIDELQEKVDKANEEIQNMKNLKQVLIKKFSVDNGEKENVNLAQLQNKPMATIIEDHVFKSPAMSPTKQVIHEMRSTIKFLKTPRMSRAPRTSMMLTPHSMSFCIKNQCERLFE